MIFAGKTDVGRRRKHNEDYFVVNEEAQFCVLADGMGGRDHGEVAAELAAGHLSKALEEDFPRWVRRLERSEAFAVATNMMDEWIRGASTRVWELSQRDAFSEMGTTLLALKIHEGHAILGHVGDSRCYRYRESEGLLLITEDHSLVNTQVKSGLISEEEAAVSKQRNIITRAVGTAKTVKPDISVFPVESGDLFLLCSDGVHDMLDDPSIAAELSTKAPLEVIAQRLIDAANEAGGKDNITVLLAREEGEG